MTERKRSTPWITQIEILFLADVEAFCRAIRPIEEQCYLEQRFNDRVVPLAREHGLLGMPVPVEYGGRGADTVDVRPGACPHRPGGDRRAHVLFGPLVDRPGADPRVGQRRAEAPIPARLDPRRDRLRVRPDRARGRQQPARDDDDLPPPRRRVRAQRREVPDLERRDRRRDRHVRLSRGPHGTDQRLSRRDRAARVFRASRSSPRSAT